MTIILLIIILLNSGIKWLIMDDTVNNKISVVAACRHSDGLFGTDNAHRHLCDAGEDAPGMPRSGVRGVLVLVLVDGLVGEEPVGSVTSH